jgi:four helix bundle protein
MTPQELRTRIKAFAYRCVAISESLPTDKLSTTVIAKQLIRSAFSGASNYRAATRAQSKPQFLSKLNIALEEVDESLDWLESIRDLHLSSAEALPNLLDEAEQLVKILGASKHTLQVNLNKKNLPKPPEEGPEIE